MADKNHLPHLRRRSSVYYDPARDTSTEIFELLRDSTEISNSAVTSSPEAPKSTEPVLSIMAADEPKKRRRSTSVKAEVMVNKAPTELSPPSKKRRPSTPEKDRMHSAESIKVPESRVPEFSRREERRDGRPPTMSRIPRHDEKSHHRHKESAQSAYSRRPDNYRAQKNGHLRDTTSPHRRPRSRSPRRRSPPSQSAYRRRSPPRTQRQRTRSPSPIRDSPPREHQKRPGGARGRGRNVLAEQQRLQAERDLATVSQNQHIAVQQASNNFYNARPEWVKERGRDWRKNESQIKGLRSFNNWVKSCIIQKFSPEEKVAEEELGWGEVAKEPEEQKPLLILDIGCGKGGDLGKWQLAPQHVALYVGLDPAQISITQANERYQQMRKGRRPIFEAQFTTKDCFGEWVGDVPIVQQVGIDPNVGQGGSSRFGGGGFDVVSMMFSMHYAFENEAKVRMMLRNVAGSLKKGGRFLGVVPNSDALAERIQDWYKLREGQDGKTADNPHPAGSETAATTITHIAPSSADTSPSFGNSIYSVRFPTAPAAIPPSTGEFRPPFSWKYTYWMAEAVDVPEFVVPWEAFRAIALDFNLEQRWRRPFLEIWEREGRDDEMMGLARRMGVLKRGERGEEELAISKEEREAVGFYAGFCFVKV